MILLRRAKRADLDSLFALDQICFSSEIAWSRREFRTLLASPKATGLVAEIDGLLAGFLFAVPSYSADHVRAGGQIVTLDVAPVYRRRGVGQRLMGEAELMLKAAGAEWLRLEVAVDNAPALAFYERLGFTATGLIRGYYHENLDAMVMEKPLVAAEKAHAV